MRTLCLLIPLCVCVVSLGQSIPPDITVALDGSGDFKSVNAAIASIPKDNRERKIMLIKDGVYHEKVRIDAAFVTLRGQSRAGTRIEFPQLNDDFAKNPDDIGRAVVNINATDCVLENLTIQNTAGVIGPHSFAVHGSTCDRTVIVDCDVLSEGADTVSLWQGDKGRYYHARCNFRGAVDFVCPRGWCYIADTTFYETKNTAALWHDGSKAETMKFVLRRCKIDGVKGFNLARHHHDAQFFLLDCIFAPSMSERAPFRVIYPLNPASQPSEADRKRNADLEKTNRWGERTFYSNCHREGGGDYAWHKDNLTQPAESITAAWTFDGTWDPESTKGPVIREVLHSDKGVGVKFSESVTVKGKPRLVLADGGTASYTSGSGTDTLTFDSAAQGEIRSLDLNDGSIIASSASASSRPADVTLPPPGK